MMKIGNIELKNRLMLAPMAGVTSLPFRMMARGMGADLVFSEMVSAMGLTLNSAKTLVLLKSHPSERPFAVQLFGSRPDAMARAACISAEAGADIIDINMGCPVKKVTKTGAGAFLMRDTNNAQEIVKAVRLSCRLPLTVKIRAGWSADRMNACEMARMMEDCGVDAISVHPRFATQGYSGKADWGLITRVKQEVSIPVIGNGDINSPSDALRMEKETGCDGLMIGRAAVRNPWIFRQILQLEKGLPVHEPDLSERRSLIMEHYNFLTDVMEEHRAALRMRGLLLSYTKGLPGSGRFRDRFTKIKDVRSLMESMDDYFSSLGEVRG
ncbi:MAG: tRNA dihydrouridine synthase DusB [Deltaproteobacteria bacterium]|nr:tRNA dihydrouridine synthase DusB [Deltaproteobacteria bacterium]